MGYVHNTDLSQFISPFAYAKNAGTWTPTVASNLVSDVRTAAGAAFVLFIPLIQPGSLVATQGAKITSVDVWYKIATAEPTAFNVGFDKVALNAQGVACAGAAVAYTLDLGHDTAAERYAIADHKLTLTPTAPVFVSKNTALWMNFAVTAHANTVWSNFGAQINFTLRL